MSEGIHNSIGAEEIAATLRGAGYRAVVAETSSGPRVQSAAQGLNFFVAFGNPAPGEDGRFTDFVFQCLLAVQGELPPALAEAWNRDMRFGRLFVQGDVLVLAMDVLVAGGVCDAWLQAQCELWDRLVRDFIRYLREPAGSTNRAAEANEQPS